jgi:hypothetical protein
MTTTTIATSVTRKPFELLNPGKCTFIPKKPVRNVSGSITTLKIVSTYRMSFCWCEMSDSFVSSSASTTSL